MMVQGPRQTPTAGSSAKREPVLKFINRYLGHINKSFEAKRTVARPHTALSQGFAMDGFNRFDLNSMPKVRPGVDPSVMVNVRPAC
jgi:hypothetical protein